jgi:hypothetical protein
MIHILLQLVCLLGGIGIGIVGMRERAKTERRRALAEQAAREDEAHQRDPFNVPAGFGVVVKATHLGVSVQASHGVDAHIAGMALRDAADLIDRPNVRLH